MYTRRSSGNTATTSSGQWALLIIQNGKLMPDTSNEITLQLTAGVAMRKESQNDTAIQFSSSYAAAVIEAINTAEKADQVQGSRAARNSVISIVESIRALIKEAQ